MLLVKSFKATVPVLNAAVVTSRRHNAINATVLTSSRHNDCISDVTIPIKGYKLHKLEAGPSTTVSLSRQDALLYYRNMQLIRHMSSATLKLFKEKKVRGVSHLYTGQEACAVGVKSAMNEDDAVITSYRCHAWALLQGSTVAEILSELTGRISGNVRGKGGSMHMYQKNFYGGAGIVGAQQSLGTGIAFAMKYSLVDRASGINPGKVAFRHRATPLQPRNEKNICITLYGDGAANQGQLSESMNMASLWKIPVLYICENNGFGIGTASSRSSASTDFYTRGDYVPGIWVDGMDVLAVREAIRWAKDYCDAGKGPLVLELATYRYDGHSMADIASSYRTQKEVEEVRENRDPIAGFIERIINSGLATKGDLDAIDKDVREEIDDAVNVANTAGLLPKEGVYTDIYHNTPHQLVRGATADDSHVQKFLNTEDIVKSLNFYDTRTKINEDVNVTITTALSRNEGIYADIYHNTSHQLLHGASKDGLQEKYLHPEDSGNLLNKERPIENELLS